MTFLNLELYEALKAAKVPENKARAAATSVHQTEQAALKALLQKEFAKLATKEEVSRAISQAVANLAAKEKLANTISKLATKEEVSRAISQAIADLAIEDKVVDIVSKTVSKLTIWILTGVMGSMFLTLSLLILLHNAAHRPPPVAEGSPALSGLPNEIYPIKVRLFSRRNTASPSVPAASSQETVSPSAPATDLDQTPNEQKPAAQE